MDTTTSKSTVAVVASMDSKFIKGSATVRFVVFVSGLEELEDISHISSECLAPAFSAARTEAIIASDTDHNFFDLSTFWQTFFNFEYILVRFRGQQ